MGSNLHPVMAMALAPFAPKVPMHQSYSFRTKTGPYKCIVDVFFDVSRDGDLQDVEVMFHNINIYNVISEDQTEQLEVEAWMYYESECKLHNDDLKINNWLASQ